MTDPSRSVPIRFRDQIAAMPECSYGVSRVVVTLDDGTTFRDVFVGWGEEIVKVGASERVPFDPSRIVRVESQR